MCSYIFVTVDFESVSGLAVSLDVRPTNDSMDAVLFFISWVIPSPSHYNSCTALRLLRYDYILFAFIFHFPSSPSCWGVRYDSKRICPSLALFIIIIIKFICHSFRIPFDFLFRALHWNNMILFMLSNWRHWPSLFFLLCLYIKML